MPPLSAERWRVLSPYLDEALEMAAEERAAWLASILARDASLAADLQTLLAAQDILHASHFLEGPVPLTSARSLTSSPSSKERPGPARDGQDDR